MFPLGCLMGLSKSSCSNLLHDSLLLALHCSPQSSLLQSVVPLFTQYFRIALEISLSYTLHSSSPSTNSSVASLKIYPESAYFLPPPFLLFKSKRPSSLTWIATIVFCSPLFDLSGLFSTQQPEPCFKAVFSYDTENKTKVHTKTIHD